MHSALIDVNSVLIRESCALSLRATLVLLLLLGSELLIHLLKRSRVLGNVLRPLFCCRWGPLRWCLSLWDLRVAMLRLDGLLLHLRVLRVGGLLLVRLLVGLLIGLLVRLRVGLVWYLTLRLDVRLRHLAKVELVRRLMSLGLCLCHGLLESLGLLEGWRSL